MANALYTKAKEKFLSGQINQLTDDIKACLVDTGSYTVEITTDEFLSDIDTSAIVQTSVNFTTKSVTSGAVDSDDVTFPSVTGASAEAIVIFKDTGDSSTSPLIAYIDTATGLPITPNGGDITITWDNGANKIFSL